MSLGVLYNCKSIHFLAVWSEERETIDFDKGFGLDRSRWFFFNLSPTCNDEHSCGVCYNPESGVFYETQRTDFYYVYTYIRKPNP